MKCSEPKILIECVSGENGRYARYTVWDHTEAKPVRISEHEQPTPAFLLALDACLRENVPLFATWDGSHPMPVWTDPHLIADQYARVLVWGFHPDLAADSYCDLETGRMLLPTPEDRARYAIDMAALKAFCVSTPTHETVRDLCENADEYWGDRRATTIVEAAERVTRTLDTTRVGYWSRAQCLCYLAVAEDWIQTVFDAERLYEGQQPMTLAEAQAAVLDYVVEHDGASTTPAPQPGGLEGRALSVIREFVRWASIQTAKPGDYVAVRMEGHHMKAFQSILLDADRRDAARAPSMAPQ